MDWLNAVVQGVLLGGQYALLACGLSLIFGVMRIVNLAHGVLAVLAAYLALVLVQQGLPLWLAIVVVVPVFAAIGYVLQRGLFNPALGGARAESGELAPLLVTFGVAVVLTNLLQEVFSADTRRIATGDLGLGGPAARPALDRRAAADHPGRRRRRSSRASSSSSPARPPAAPCAPSPTTPGPPR